MTKQQKIEREEAVAKLREWVKPGDKVYTILRQASRSGMSRHISTLIVDKASGDAFEISGYVAKAIERRRADDGGIVVQGCGMDMGVEVVYNLSRVLFPDGFATTASVRCAKCLDVPGKDGLGRPCKSCDGLTGYSIVPVRGRNGDMSGHDNDGGYALRQVWL